MYALTLRWGWQSVPAVLSLLPHCPDRMNGWALKKQVEVIPHWYNQHYAAKNILIPLFNNSTGTTGQNLLAETINWTTCIVKFQVGWLYQCRMISICFADNCWLWQKQIFENILFQLTAKHPPLFKFKPCPSAIVSLVRAPRAGSDCFVWNLEWEFLEWREI